MVTTLNITVLRIQKLLQKLIPKFSSQEKELLLCMVMDVN